MALAEFRVYLNDTAATEEQLDLFRGFVSIRRSASPPRRNSMSI